MTHILALLTALAASAFASACAQSTSVEAPSWAAFENPQPVTVTGYSGDLMEPFLSRDGQILFFNNRNPPAEQTDLHWAERVDDVTFRYRGLVAGANTSDNLDAVATMSAEGRLCFVSLRSYFESLSTIYCGDWMSGDIENVALQSALTQNILGRLVFDAEIAPDGETIIYADGTFTGDPFPARAELRTGALGDLGFVITPENDATLEALNTPALEFAPALSSDGLMIAFTRAEGRLPLIRFGIWLARRDDVSAAFGEPVLISAISGGLFEAPTFSPDNRALYHHRAENDRYSLWRVSLPSQ